MGKLINTIKIDLYGDKPEFVTYESVTQGLTDKMFGKNLRGIINFRVVEKTNKFVILKIEFVHLLNSRRIT